jgi:4'-phosphopantetheinyl transferase
VRFLSQFAREAVAASAQRSGIDLPKFEKDSEGVPVPSSGIFWSLSHKPEYVAGVISDHPVGIDIEQIRPVQPSLVNRIINSDEQQVTGPVSDAMFFRCWTAKEAVLKAVGAGLKGLSQCRIHHIIDKTTLVVSCHQKHWLIEHVYYDNYIASVVRSEKDVQWILPVS